MLDNHTPERRPETAAGARDGRAESRTERMADREVPLPVRRTSRTPAAVHAWLDGDLPEAAVRRGDTAKHVEFWKELNTEADKRRQMRTPPHVYAQIMSSLPQTTPRVITPWWRRQFAMTPMIAMAVGAALLAIGAAVALLVNR